MSDKTCTRHELCIQVWEQEFAWTEADKPIKLAARALTMPGDHELNKQPIFCFETMMHMLYWSCLVYDHKRVSCCWALTCLYAPEHHITSNQVGLSEFMMHMLFLVCLL